MADEDDLWGVGHDADLLPDAQLVAADLRVAYLRDPEPEIVTRHVAAMVSAVGAPVIPLTSRRRRRVAVAGAVACAGIVLTGGLAAAGVLPTALQDGVANLVRPIGIDLTHADERGPSGARTDDQDGTSRGDQPQADDGSSDPVSGADLGSSTTVAGSDANPGVTVSGQTGDLPLPTTTAPGQTADGPGRSATAPGQTGAGGNNKPDVPPGQVDNPGQGKGKGNGKNATTTTTAG